MLDRTTESAARTPRPKAPSAAAAALGAKRRVGLRRMCALGLAILRFAKLLEPHPPHRFPQSRRPGRAGHRRALSLAVPRRPDRCAGAKPAGAGRDHCRRDRRVRRPSKPTPSRSIPSGCSNCRPAKATARPTKRCPASNFPINPERVAPVLRRLVSPTKTRARIYDRDGVLILDSRNLYGRGDVLRFDLPPPNAERARLHGARVYRVAALVRARRSARSTTSSARKTARVIRKSRRRLTARTRAWCASTNAAK